MNAARREASLAPGPQAPGAPRNSIDGRHLSLDVARGLALLGMIFVHFVPAQAGESPLGRAGTGFMRFLEAESAVLFFVLIGVSWAIQAERAGGSPWFRYAFRRSLTLAAAGILLHFVWPTEVLLPLALTMILSLAVIRAGLRTVAACGGVLVAAAPVMRFLLGGYASADWLENGSHVGETAPGWATLRYLLFDGNYPLVPWLTFPLLGIGMVKGGWFRVGRARGWFFVAMPAAVLASGWAVWAEAHVTALGSLAPYLTSTWVPTSIPFVLAAGGFAAALIAGLVWWQQAAGLPRAAAPSALLGRASLTHYVLHICAVFLPLRLLYPDEDWPWQVGLLAFAGYIVLAVPLTAFWFRRFSRGPLEGLWAIASGGTR